MKMWKSNGASPVEVECQNGTAYPAVDADRDTIFVNSHFPSKEEAWASIRSNARARVHMAGERVNNANAVLLKANEEAGAAAAHFADVEDGYRRDASGRGVT